MDNICSNCYKNSSYSGMTARSIKIEDIEEVITYDYTSYENYNESPYTYSSQSYPYIWGQYENSSIANRSTAYSLTTEEFVWDQTFTPLHSYWTKDGFSFENASTEWSNSKYYELTVKFAESVTGWYDNYWLASRYENSLGDRCVFGIYRQEGTGFKPQSLANSKREEWDSYCRVRPLVSIPVKSCTISDSTDSNYDYHIEPKA